MSEFKTNQLLECKCGFKPDHYNVYYGRTPYDVICPVCKKQTTMAKCKVTNNPMNLISYWNDHIRHLTLEEMEAEVTEFRKEQKENTGYDLYTEYNYYWYLNEGEILHKSA